MKADLRRQRQDGKGSAVARPGNFVDVPQCGTPPRAPRTVGADDVKARGFGLDHGVHVGQRIGKPRVGQHRVVRAIGRDQGGMNAPRQGGQRDGSGGGSGGSIGGRQRQGGQLPHLVDLINAKQRGAVAGESRGLEGVGNIEVAGLAAGSRDEVPLGVVRAFGGPELDLIENGLAIGRDGDGLRVSACWRSRRR